MKTHNVQLGRQTVVIQRFQTLQVNHCVSTRKGGVSEGAYAEMNVGPHDDDGYGLTIANRKLVCAAAMLNGLTVCCMEQVHGAKVGIVGAEDCGTIDECAQVPAVDALVTKTPGVTLMARSADCPLILIHAPSTPALAVVHSGWRGTLANVVKNTIERMSAEFGCDPAETVAGISPSISVRHYEVQPDVIDSFKAAYPDMPKTCYELKNGAQTGRLDLARIIEWQLQRCGIGQVERAETCTFERTDLFYSYRRDGENTGRFGLFAQLPP